MQVPPHSSLKVDVDPNRGVPTNMCLRIRVLLDFHVRVCEHMVVFQFCFAELSNPMSPPESRPSQSQVARCSSRTATGDVQCQTPPGVPGTFSAPPEMLLSQTLKKPNRPDRFLYVFFSGGPPKWRGFALGFPLEPAKEGKVPFEKDLAICYRYPVAVCSENRPDFMGSMMGTSELVRFKTNSLRSLWQATNLWNGRAAFARHGAQPCRLSSDTFPLFVLLLDYQYLP